MIVSIVAIVFTDSRLWTKAITALGRIHNKMTLRLVFFNNFAIGNKNRQTVKAMEFLIILVEAVIFFFLILAMVHYMDRKDGQKAGH